MTNLFKTFPTPPKAILIHGLNNNLESFWPLRDALISRGIDTVLISPPGHGDNREEANHLSSACEAFDEKIKKAISGPYFTIAFSQGALFSELWQEKNPHYRPLGQILLAPALFIKHDLFLNKIIHLLPHSLSIRSQTPKAFRRYQRLFIWEYQTLFEATLKYQETTKKFQTPTLVMVDQNDELIDVNRLKAQVSASHESKTQIKILNRKYLKGRRPGKYHILFHPDYFTLDDWHQLLWDIENFIKEILNARV